MFKEFRQRLYEIERQSMIETLSKLVMSLEYLQVALKNGEDIDRWLSMCSKETQRLSTHFRLLKLFLVKE